MGDQNWACFSVPVDHNTVIDFNYGMAGQNPEEVEFEAYQKMNNNESGEDETITLASRSQRRQDSFLIESKGMSPIELCWRNLDDKKKILDFHFTRNLASSTEKADVELLDGISDDLDLIKTEINKISKLLTKKMSRSQTVHSADAAAA